MTDTSNGKITYAVEVGALPEAAVLSPDGRHVAVLVSAKDGRVQLYTVDLPSMKVAGLTSFEDADISSIAWVNERRIV